MLPLSLHTPAPKCTSPPPWVSSALRRVHTPPGPSLCTPLRHYPTTDTLPGAIEAHTGPKIHALGAGQREAERRQRHTCISVTSTANAHAGEHEHSPLAVTYERWAACAPTCPEHCPGCTCAPRCGARAFPACEARHGTQSDTRDHSVTPSLHRDLPT